ncbi:MAG: hypothetical protein ABFS46_05060 [Myxococcota bacterium]
MGVGKSLAEIHAFERARWDSLAPTALAADSRLPVGAGFASERCPLLTGISEFLGDVRGVLLMTK